MQHSLAHTTIKRTRKGVDELNLNVVAQGNVTMTNKGKATFRLPTVRRLQDEQMREGVYTKYTKPEQCARNQVQRNRQSVY
jgi:tetraacyldisaccharide-1-P 4'-kinase